MHPRVWGAAELLILLVGVQLFPPVPVNLCVRGIGSCGSTIVIESIGAAVTLLLGLCRFRHVGSW
jgi:hypothetical protein